MRFLIVAAGLVLASAAPAPAQVAVEEIKAQLVLERSGRLSENIVGSGKRFHNTIIGEGDAEEPAESVLVTLSVSGPKNSRSSDKIARDLMQVTVKQRAKAGEKLLVSRAFGGFLFGEAGRYHKVLLLENVTCAPLEIEAKAGRSRKLAKLDFSCGE